MRYTLAYTKTPYPTTYSFQGQERDDEVTGMGNSYDFGARMSDSRIGRFLSVDPIDFKFPDFSPFSFCLNNPLVFVDPTGEEPSPAAYKSAAKKLGVSVAQIRAVYKSEVQNSAFFSDGKTKILFERHYFSRLTNGKYDKSNPSISNPDPGGYGLYSQQYDKLAQAKALNSKAALMSISWGGFQIMGENYKAAGFGSVEDMAKVMMSGDEDAHLQAFTNFIISNKEMHQALKDKNWSKFASKYNGPNYKDNNYDTKMNDNYEALKNNPLEGLVDDKPILVKKLPQNIILPAQKKATVPDALRIDPSYFPKPIEIKIPNLTTIKKG